MITVKDPALGQYGIIEDAQGFKVIDGDGKNAVKVGSFEEALRFIANKLALEDDATLTLGQYTKRRKDIFNKIIAAQEEIGVSVPPSTQQVIEFGETAHV